MNTRHTVARARALARLEVQRVAETRRSFANWPLVLGQVGLQQVGRGTDAITFRTRTGLRVECPNRPGARVPVYEVFAEDWYQLPWFLDQLTDRPITVIDVGAHIGTFALHLAQVHPQATIHCFEPSPTTANFLRRNVELNGFADRIAVVESALSSERGEAQLSDNRSGSGHNRLVRLGGAKPGGHATTVTTVTFDEAVRSSVSLVDVVKIDCEGAEYDFVLGSSASSWTSVERVVLEYHQVEGRTWDELRDWFAAVGLHVVKHSSVVAGVGAAWLSRQPLPA